MLKETTYRFDNDDNIACASGKKFINDFFVKINLILVKVKDFRSFYTTWILRANMW